MTVETAIYISDLNAAYPAAGDPKSEGDDHLRLLKTVTKATFPNVAGAVTPTHTELNFMDGVTSAVQTQLDTLTGTFATYAPLASPALTGSPTSTTPALTDPATRIATLGAVSAAIGAVNAQAVLANSIEAASAFNIAVGTHHIITNVGLTTATAPASPTAGQRFRVSVANGLFTNVIAWNGINHESISDANMTIDSANASCEWSYINSTVGWKVIP